MELGKPKYKLLKYACNHQYALFPLFSNIVKMNDCKKHTSNLTWYRFSNEWKEKVVGYISVMS